MMMMMMVVVDGKGPWRRALMGRCGKLKGNNACVGGQRWRIKNNLPSFHDGKAGLYTHIPRFLLP